MSLRRAMRCSRRRATVALILLVLGSAVAVHHAMPGDMHAMPGHTVCLAVLAAGALIAAVAVIGVTRARPPRPTSVALPASRCVTCSWSIPARAGPLFLRLLVLRL